MINDKILNEKKDYLVVGSCHERYSFETTLNIYRNKSLIDICDDNIWMTPDKLEQERDGFIFERSGHGELDTKYEYPDLPGDKLQKIMLDVIYIIPLDTLLKEEYTSFIWGATENKFGLLDIKRKEGN